MNLNISTDIHDHIDALADAGWAPADQVDVFGANIKGVYNGDFAVAFNPDLNHVFVICVDADDLYGLRVQKPSGMILHSTVWFNKNHLGMAMLLALATNI